jgi:hypothetical protein
MAARRYTAGLEEASVAEDLIESVEDFIGAIRADVGRWRDERLPARHVWFRGEGVQFDPPLLPSVYRPKADGSMHNENTLLQHFRMRAPIFGEQQMPDRDATDEWLFLAQHCLLPTRLLDWTTSALAALFFALPQEAPVVWMLNPIELNRRTFGVDGQLNLEDEFPLTWHKSKEGDHIGNVNIRAAWEKDSMGTELPVAVMPTNIHRRMSVQRSCFTIHGRRKESLTALVNHDPRILRRYAIHPEARRVIRDDLRVLGVDHSTVYPELDGLARELKELY